MARSPLLRNLIAVSRLVHSTEGQAKDYDSALALRSSRRQLLSVGVAATTAAVLGATPLNALALTYAPSRVAIVGGGLAGMRCAYELQKSGIPSTVYEANPARLGGRVFSNRNTFGVNVAENGGELIDSIHTNVLALTKELGLVLDDCGGWAAERGLEEMYYVNGQKYTFAQAFENFKAMANQLNQDRAKAQFPQTWDNMSERGRELDNMTVREYISRYAPGGLTSNFGRVLDVAYNIEYGAETDQQGAYGLVALLGYSNTTLNGNSAPQGNLWVDFEDFCG